MLIEKNKVIFMFLVVFSAQNNMWSMMEILKPIVPYTVKGLQKTGLTEISYKVTFGITNFFKRKISPQPEFVVDASKVPEEKNELYKKNAKFISTRLDHLYDKDGLLDIKEDDRNTEFLNIVDPLFNTPLIQALKVKKEKINEKIKKVGFDARKKKSVQDLLKTESINFHKESITELLMNGTKIQDTTDKLNEIIQNKKNDLNKVFNSVRGGVLATFPKDEIENKSIQKFKTKVEEWIKYFDEPKNHDSFDEMYASLKGVLSDFNNEITQENKTFVHTIREASKDVKLNESNLDNCRNNFIQHIKDVKQNKNVIPEEEFNNYRGQLVDSLDKVFGAIVSNKENKVDYGELKNKLDECIDKFEFKSEARKISENFQIQLDSVFQDKVIKDNAQNIALKKIKKHIKNTKDELFKKDKETRENILKQAQEAIKTVFKNIDQHEKNEDNFKENITNYVNNIEIIKNITEHFATRADDASVRFKSAFEAIKTNFVNAIIVDSSREKLNRKIVEDFTNQVSDALCAYTDLEHTQNQSKDNKRDVKAFVKNQKDTAENEHKLEIEKTSKNFTEYANGIVESFIWGSNPLIGGAAVGTRWALNSLHKKANEPDLAPRDGDSADEKKKKMRGMALYKDLIVNPINKGKTKVYETTKNIFGEDVANKAALVGNKGNYAAFMMTLVMFHTWLFKKTTFNGTKFFEFFTDKRNQILSFIKPVYIKFWNGVKYVFAPAKKNPQRKSTQ